MERQAEALNFERAAVLRDQIAAIEVLSKKQKVISGAMPETDIWGLYRGTVKSCYAVLHYRDGQLVSRETEVFAARMDEQAEEMLPLLLAQYYLGRSALPREIWLPLPMEDMDTMEQALSLHSSEHVLVRFPRRGEKADLVRLANRNAEEEAERVTTEEERTSRTLELLAKMTGLPQPDVFLIDGGATHAAVAETVLARFHQHIPVFGMVKDDRHRTRALIRADGCEIGIQASEPVFALIGRIQEETHRFAVSYHHQRHTKSTYRSALDGIPGVGETRKKQLLKTFGTVRAVREAELEALEKVLPGNAARAVYDHFRQQAEENREETT